MRSPHSRRRGPGRLALALTVLVAAGVGLAVGAFGYEPLTALLGLGAAPAAPAAPGEPVPASRAPLPTLNGTMNLLFMATDVEYVYKNGRRAMGLRGRTDTMILARMDPSSHEARLLSIPRDTRVSLPGYGHVKINAANPYGGPDLA